MDTIQAYRVTVKGRVQGVGFRYSTRQKASSLSVIGWVRNLPGGKVEIQCQGDSQSINTFLSWLTSGPPGARVESVQKQETPVKKPDAYGKRFSIAL